MFLYYCTYWGVSHMQQKALAKAADANYKPLDEANPTKQPAQVRRP
jgi:hypothetical protein